MRKLFLILAISIICVSCGKKGDPEYKSLNYKNNTIEII